VTTPYRLLNTFESLFNGKPYLHRASNQNDLVCAEFFEDLFILGRSPKLIARINNEQCVVNTGNKVHGVKARRGDGTFGELVPGEVPGQSKDYQVSRGVIAVIEIGVECKILSKAMVKQIGRVMNDMRDQVSQFRRGTGSKPITVAIVGVNHAEYATGYEGSQTWKTGWVERLNAATGKMNRQYHKHPIEEAAEAIRRLDEEVRSHYDEMLVLRYKATNEAPFPFEWVDVTATQRDYAALLTKISREYEQRF
jgi:hypothetical protein